MKEAMKGKIPRWSPLPQRVKLGLAVLLLAIAVAVWYGGLYLPAQAGIDAPPRTLEEEVSRPLEAPPIPFLSGDAPPLAETPSREQAPPLPSSPASQAKPPLPKGEEPLPDPFVPLPVTAKAQPQTPPLPTPPELPALPPPPVPTGPFPSAEVLPRSQGASKSVLSHLPLPGSSGALPPPKILLPSPQPEALMRSSPANRPVEPAPPASLVEAPLPSTKGSPGEEKPEVSPSRGEGGKGVRLEETPLRLLARERGWKPISVLMGPVSVVILESREGYLAVPVGDTIPGSDAVVRRVEGDRVVLAMGGEILELGMDAPDEGGAE